MEKYRVGAYLHILMEADKKTLQIVVLKMMGYAPKEISTCNVLFEYGLFMGALSKENVCFVCKGKPKLASDLKGITYIDGDLGDIQVKLKLKDWINEMKK